MIKQSGFKFGVMLKILLAKQTFYLSLSLNICKSSELDKHKWHRMEISPDGFDNILQVENKCPMSNQNQNSQLMLNTNHFSADTSCWTPRQTSALSNTCVVNYLPSYQAGWKHFRHISIKNKFYTVANENIPKLIKAFLFL